MDFLDILRGVIGPNKRSDFQAKFSFDQFWSLTGAFFLTISKLQDGAFAYVSWPARGTRMRSGRPGHSGAGAEKLAAAIASRLEEAALTLIYDYPMTTKSEMTLKEEVK